MANLLEYMGNHRGHYLKKAMFDVLQERYAQNEPIIERLSVSLITEGDIKGFLKFVTDVYEAAYMKAIEDHKEALKKAGFAARIVSPDKK